MEETKNEKKRKSVYLPALYPSAVVMEICEEAKLYKAMMTNEMNVSISIE